jgi:cytochrome c551/c552
VLAFETLMAETIVWTDAARTQLAASRFKPVAESTTRIAKLVKKHGPSWKKWAAKMSPNAKRLAKLAADWKPGAKLDLEQLALLVTLLGGIESQVEIPALGSAIVEEHGVEVAQRVLVRLWPLRGDKAEFMISMSPDDWSMHDTSMSWHRRYFAEYLGERARHADAKAAAKAISKLWPTTPRYAKTPLAIAANDPVRGAEIALELLKHDEPHPYYPWSALPHFVCDSVVVAKLMKVGEEEPSLRMLDNLGTKAIPFVYKALVATRDRSTREDLMRIAVNIKAPRIARALAEYVGQQPYSDIVRDYFTRHPDLLKLVMRDSALEYHRDDLAKLSLR